MKQRAPAAVFDLPTVTLKPHGVNRLGRGHPWVKTNVVEMDDAAKAVPPGG